MRTRNDTKKRAKLLIDMKKILFYMMTASIVLTGACEKEEEKVAVAGVTLEPTTSATLTVGETLLLTAIVTPDNATDKTITWESSNKDVAVVNDGFVAGLSSGIATITATTQDGSKTATCTVSVNWSTTPKQMTMTTEILEVSISIYGFDEVNIDWGDGTEIETHTFLDNRFAHIGHNYSIASVHTITITGKNITHLNCTNMQLTNLNVRGNTALVELNCAGNQLTELDVSKNTVLKSLSCVGNQLKKLDVSHNFVLSSLYCNINQLTELDISKNTALFTLYCINNQLTELDVSNNTELYILQCFDNKLTKLKFGNNHRLQDVLCHNNQLSDLDISNNTALWTLSCFNNIITSLDLSKNTDLHYVYCQSNKLSNKALNDLFKTLHSKIADKTIFIGDNPGTDTCDQTIATKKGWKIDIDL